MFRAAGLVYASCILLGCSFVDRQQSTETRYQEVTVDSSVWSAIVPGVTDEQWLLRHLGPPAVIEQSQQEKVFVYPLVAETTDRLNVFLFYNRQSMDRRHFQKRIHLNKGKVSRVETVQPVPTAVDTQVISLAPDPLPEAGPAPAKAADKAPQAPVTQDPYEHGQTDPFAHPWPFGGSR